jgi:flagellar biosynthesis protein FliR
MDYLPIAERLLASAGFSTNLPGFLVLFGLALARVLTAIYLAPFFGGQTVPSRLRVGMAVVFTVVLLPNLTVPPGFTISPVLFIALLAKELLAGAMLGIVCQFVFYGIQMAGVLIDTQRGMNQLNYFAPQLAGPASVLGQLKLQLAIALFLSAGGHLLYLRTLDATFRQLPVLQFPRFGEGTAFLDAMARLSANALVTGLQLAAPAMLALLLVDVSFGVLGRVASQIQAHQESQPVKALAGLGVVLLGSAFLMEQMVAQLGALVQNLQQVAALLKP